jgi:hypothetical protein
VLGGRRIAIERPRVRSIQGRELRVLSFEADWHEDLLDRATLAAITSGVTIRRYGCGLKPLPRDERGHSTSRSSVSWRFVALTQPRLLKAFSSPLRKLGLRTVLVDGIAFRERCVLLALGVAADGAKHVLRLWDRSTESSAVAKLLLRDPIERGLPKERGLLFVTMAPKTRRKAIGDVFGGRGLVRRCRVHKRHNVLEHLPEALRPSVRRVLR